MTVNVPSDAKEIVLFFHTKTGLKPTRQSMARYTVSAKDMLEAGYAKQDILDVITFAIDVKKQYIYSYGFIAKCIDVLLMELREHQELQRMKELMSTPKVEVSDDGKSGERNRAKASRFSAKSRFGKELDFNMLKE